MSGSEDAKALSGAYPQPAQVEAYLRRHPEFLAERPELIAALVPPGFDRGAGVLDMQRFMLQRLRGEVAQLKARERTLLAAAEANIAVRARIHHAAKAVLAARSFEHLIRVVVDEVPGMLDVAASALGVENGDRLPGNAGDTGVVVLRPGTVDALAAPDRPVVLMRDTAGDPVLFGADAPRLRSVALMRLDFGPEAPAGLFALGATAPDWFDPGQGTDLLAFLAHVLQLCIRRWLGLAS